MCFNFCRASNPLNKYVVIVDIDITPGALPGKYRLNIDLVCIHYTICHDWVYLENVFGYLEIKLH